MKAKTVHCEECMEEIPGDEVYWEDERLYCGRCGSELEITQGARDVMDEFARKRTATWQTADDDAGDDDDLEEDDEEDDEFDDDEDEDWELEEEMDEDEKEEEER